MDNTSISLHTFAWSTLTNQQKYRINVKYELVQELNRLNPDDCKRNVYRAIADKHCYTMRTIEKIAVELNKE